MIGKTNVGGGKKSGQYVWKKYNGIPNPTVSAEQTVAKPATFVLSSDNTDLTAYSFSDLKGLKIALESDTTTYFEVTGDGTVDFYWSGSLSSFNSCTWDASTKTLVVTGKEYNAVGSNWIASDLVGKQVFLDFVVSDDPTAYPDGGTQNGYWYERVMEGIDILSYGGFTKCAVDKFTFTTRSSLNSTTIPHSLGEKPRWFVIFAKTESDVEYDLLYASYYRPSSQTILGSSHYYLRSGSSTSSVGNSGTLNMDETQITRLIQSGASSSYKYGAGIEYTLITMA